MNRKALKTVEHHGMLKSGDRVIAAVSGGGDSVALLHFLCFCPIPNLQVSVCHLNHCLRGEESDRDQRLVESMCREYGLKLFAERKDVALQAKAAGISEEMAGRMLRYEMFERLSRQENAKIATAHTLSDTAETVIFNMMRGTGLEGLCGIPYVRGHLIRPLLDCTRQEIEAYCTDHSLCYNIDSTNADERYARNLIRHRVIGALEELSTGSVSNMGAMCERLRSDARFLNETAEKAWQAAQTMSPHGFAGLSTQYLKQLDCAILHRVLRTFLQKGSVTVDAKRIGMLEQMLEQEQLHTVSMGEGLQVRRRENVLFWQKIQPKPRRRGLKPVQNITKYE